VKKVVYFLVAIVLLAGLISGCAGPALTPAPTQAPTTAPTAPPAVEPIKLTVASWEGPGACIMEPFDMLYVKELEGMSGGRVKCEIAYGSAMGAPPEHYDLAVTGVADITHVGLPYTPGRFPMAEVIELPIAKMTPLQLTRGYWELYKKGYFDEDFKDVKVLYLPVVGPYDYQMAKIPVSTFDDMKGLKIRASGKVHTEVVEALGSVPVGMPAPDVYTSLEKGVVDGSFSPWDFMYAFRTEPVTKYVSRVSICGFGHALVMNKESYAKLPADIQAIIDEMSANDKYAILAGQKITEYGQIMQYDIFEKAGGEVTEIPEAELTKVWDAVSPIWQNWIAEGEEKGLPRKQMVDDLYYIFRHMGIERPFHGYAP
jgi:TRAP-type C4-dicarboxylate transport system substrate-binding protein